MIFSLISGVVNTFSVLSRVDVHEWTWLRCYHHYRCIVEARYMGISQLRCVLEVKSWYKIGSRKRPFQIENIRFYISDRILRIAQQLAQIKIYIRSFPGVAILQIALKRGLTRLNHHNSTTMSMLTTRMYDWESMFIELMVIQWLTGNSQHKLPQETRGYIFYFVPIVEQSVVSAFSHRSWLGSKHKIYFKTAVHSVSYYLSTIRFIGTKRRSIYNSKQPLILRNSEIAHQQM